MVDFASPDVLEAFLHTRVYRELDEHGIPGAAVCVSKAGRYNYSLANVYGFSDPAAGQVLDPLCSLFDLGPCAKLLAAAALLRLLQERRMSVATEANSLLPPDLQIECAFGPVTLQHLLSHTSGLAPSAGANGGPGPGPGAGEHCPTPQPLVQPAAGGAAAAAESLQEAFGMGSAAAPDAQRPSLSVAVPLAPAPPPAPSPGASRRRASVRLPDAAEADEASCYPTAITSPTAQQQQKHQAFADHAMRRTGSAAILVGGETGEPPPPPPLQPPPPPPPPGQPRGATPTPVMSYLLACRPYGAKPTGVYRPADVDYWLVGAVVETLVGVPYHDHVYDTLLAPLGVRLLSQQQLLLGHSRAERRRRRKEQRGQAGEDGPGAGSAVGEDADDVEEDDEGDEEEGEGNADVPRVWVCMQREGDTGRGGSDSGGAGVGEGQGGWVAEGQQVPAGVADDEERTEEKPPQSTAWVAVPCCPGPLTPIGGLVLPAYAISRFLALFAHEPVAAAAAATAAATASTAAPLHSSDMVDETRGGAREGAVGASVLGALCEIRLTDYLRDAGVAYGGLLALGLGRQGDSVVAAESQPPPPPLPPPAAGPRGPSAPEGSGAGAVQALPASSARAAASAAAPPQHHAALVLLAPASGLALAVASSATGQQAAALCRRLASLLLEAFPAAALPPPASRSASWLPALPPVRPDALAHLVAFPPACTPAPMALFEGWSLQLPEYIRVRVAQAPGHGHRRSEPCLLRLAKLVGPAAAAIASGLPPDAPLALFGHGLGALWAYEVARRLEGWHGRRVLHLFVCACPGPGCFPGGGGAAAGGGGGGAFAPFEPWRQTPAPAAGPSGHAGAHAARDLYELPDEEFARQLAAHPRCPKALQAKPEAIMEHLSLLRADVEVETSYSHVPPPPPLAPAVAAVLAGLHTHSRAEEESRLSHGLLSCPVTVFTPEDDATHAPLSRAAAAAAWEQVTTGRVQHVALPGDHQLLEDRRATSALMAAVASSLGRQLSPHTAWLRKLRPAGPAGGQRARTAAAGAGRPGSGGGPGLGQGREAGAGGGGGGGGAAVGGGAGTLPPVYPR